MLETINNKHMTDFNEYNQPLNYSGKKYEDLALLPMRLLPIRDQMM